MTKLSKRHKKNVETNDRNQELPLEDAVAKLKGFQGTKFDETVEVAIRTGIDPKQTAQAIRGAFSLPHGIGKTVKVIAFCEGDDARAAQEAGAAEVGSDELAQKIKDGWLDFDVAVAHPSMMKHVGQLGRILGPHGKMPSPKSGTVTTEISAVVREFVAGKIEFRNDAGAIIHAPMGKKSFAKEQLVDNIRAFVDHVVTLKPAAAKGVFIRRVFIKSTMSPAVQVTVASS